MKKKTKRILKWLGTTALIIFLVALGVFVYNFVSDNNYLILAISGGVVLVSILAGFLSTRKVKRKLKGWWRSF